MLPPPHIGTAVPGNGGHVHCPLALHVSLQLCDFLHLVTESCAPIIDVPVADAKSNFNNHS